MLLPAIRILCPRFNSNAAPEFFATTSFFKIAIGSPCDHTPAKRFGCSMMRRQVSTAGELDRVRLRPSTGLTASPAVEDIPRHHNLPPDEWQSLTLPRAPRDNSNGRPIHEDDRYLLWHARSSGYIRAYSG